MNPEIINNHLLSKGFNSKLGSDDTTLSVSFTVGDKDITLLHHFPAEITQLPVFYLVRPLEFGVLAHIVPVENLELGFVCVQDRESISVNFEVAELAYSDSLRRHIELIDKLIRDPEWNRQELLREFRSNWEILCSRSKTSRERLYFACDSTNSGSALIKRPEKRSKNGINSHYLGLDSDQASTPSFKTFRTSVHWDKREASGKAIVVELASIEPAPTDLNVLPDWYVHALDSLCPESARRLKQFLRRSSKEFWVVFSSPASSGSIWFAVRITSNKKAPFPTTLDSCESWKIEPIVVRPLDRDSVVPRSGAQLSLAPKSVLLVGCGSVGSELAHRLASTGIGKILISDPDEFNEDNLYRHTLPVRDIGLYKSACVAFDLRCKYPWIRSDHTYKKLEDFKDVNELKEFDLIIIAIGSPTIERVFHDFVLANDVSTPVINTWVEAYGVGGHATLDIASSKGCLRCAYLDPVTLYRGLSSNLNFLKPNQDLTVTHGGCGNLFLPYSGISASYTATMAADLASQFLNSNVQRSSKMSWKGNSKEAEAEGFSMSHRFWHFSKQLETLDLHNPDCDVCAN